GAVGNCEALGEERLPFCTVPAGAAATGGGGGGGETVSRLPNRELWHPARTMPAAARLSRLAFEIPIWFSISAFLIRGWGCPGLPTEALQCDNIGPIKWLYG